MVCDQKCSGPGYASPLDAMRGPRERLVYLPCLPLDNSKPDYLSTVDVDPESSTYCQVVHRLVMPNTGDELHHTGWNACSSCHDDETRSRNKLIVPGLMSSRVYIVDTSDQRAPYVSHTVEPEEMKAAGVTHPHTSHCLGNGQIMVSTLGDADGVASGNFVLLDGKTFEVKGKATSGLPRGYDFWYQPRLDVMISTELADMRMFSKGFNPAHIAEYYGNSVHVMSWEDKKLIKSLDLGVGSIPLEARFLHEPTGAHAFVGCSLSSSIVHIFKIDDEWMHKTIIKQPFVPVDGWALPEMPPFITDIIISLNDRFLYFGNWFQGDVCQYDITDPANPVLAGRVWVGGLLKKGSTFKATGTMPTEDGLPPDAAHVKGVEIRGGPQMLQLSLDGKRLYITTSLFKAWDMQFYGHDLGKTGSQMVQVDIDVENGGMKLNDNFLVDFGDEPGGPALAHEVRYPGGDCTSDIWL